MKKEMKITALVVLLVAALCAVSGCTGSYAGTTGDPSQASLAVLYSTDAKQQSAIQWLDDELNVVGTSKYPYAQAVVSFENAKAQDGKLYLAPVGTASEKDEQDAIIVDTQTGDYEAVTLETSNHVAQDVEGQTWIISSNLNGEGCIDAVDLKTKEVKTYKDSALWDDKIMQVALVNGEIYGAGANDTQSGIYHIDMDNKTVEKVYTCSDDPMEHTPSYLARHGDDLVFISEGSMVRYGTKTGKATSTKLSRNDADIINVQGDYAWIVYTDQHAEEYESLIEVRDYASGEVIGSATCDFAVWQLEPSKESAYAAGYDKMAKFTFEDGKLSLASELPYDPAYADFFAGGVYALNG